MYRWWSQLSSKLTMVWKVLHLIQDDKENIYKRKKTDVQNSKPAIFFFHIILQQSKTVLRDPKDKRRHTLLSLWRKASSKRELLSQCTERNWRTRHFQDFSRVLQSASLFPERISMIFIWFPDLLYNFEQNLHHGFTCPITTSVLGLFVFCFF